MGAQGKALYIVIGLLAALGVAGALFLSGALGGGEEVTPEVGAGDSARRAPVAEAPAKPEFQPRGRIETDEFRGREDDRKPSTTRVSDRNTGLSLRGIVRDAQNQPVVNARVILTRDTSTVKGRFIEGPTLAEADTPGTGEFQFRDILPDLSYVVRVEHPDYAIVRDGPIDSRDANQLQRVITLRPGVLLTGVVTEESGAPIEGAVVAVYDAMLQTLDPRGVVERKVETGVDGTFGLPNLAPGQKKIIVTKSGFAADGRNMFNLTEIEQPKLQFVLKKGLAIRGVVRDAATGQPIAGAEIWARPVGRIMPPPTSQPEVSPDEESKEAGDGGAVGFSRPPLPTGAEGETAGAVGNPQAAMATRQAEMRMMADREFLVGHAVSEEDGSFEIAGVMEARYMITAMRKGYLPISGRPATSGEDKVELTMTASARVLGRVIDAETGNPIKTFAVSVHPSMEPLFYNPAMRQDFNDEDGRFEYVDVQPGRMYVFAEVQGYAIARSEPIDVAAQQVITDVVLRVERGATLTGLVLDAQSQPIRGALATLVADTPGEPEHEFIKIIRNQMRAGSAKTATTDAEGRWTMPNVRNGSYRVDVTHPAYQAGKSDAFQCGNSGEFEVPAVVLSQGGTIRGVVMKKDGSGPDGKAIVMIRPASGAAMGEPSTQTDANGVFERRGLPPGLYRVLVPQREGAFDLMAVMQQTGGVEVLVRDGEVVEVSL